MSKIEIRGEQYSVGDIFGDKFAFNVPPYQRPYAWTTEHAGELLDDLLSYLGDSDDAIEDLNPYFLGSIVLIKGERPDAQIVDGQQRLITLTILLAALRVLIPERYVESITERIYEPADPLRGIPARFRLHPKDRDVGFFQQYIQSEGGIERLNGQIHIDLSESQRNMRDNALYYRRELSKLPEERRLRLAQFIVQRCLLIAVTTPDLDSAYRIFSILNDRGLDLTTADILKAEVIGQIPSVLQQDYTERWEDMEEKLGTRDFSEFFGHLRTMYRKARAQTSVLDEFRTFVMPASANMEHLIDDIVLPLASAYCCVKTSTYTHENDEAASQINCLLRWLNQIDNSDWMPPAIRYLSRYHDQPVRLVRFFSELERLAASLMIRRQYAHRRQPRYSQLVRAIEQGEDLSKPGSPIQLTQQERDETVGALSGDFYLMAATPRNYALQRLDSYLAGSGAVYDHKIMTVEHVLPRNPTRGSEWMLRFPTEAERSRWVHRLGNLALLSREKNRQAYNYDFATKKRAYFATKGGISPFALTTQVLQEEEWTPAVIERRQQVLIDHLRQIWRL